MSFDTATKSAVLANIDSLRSQVAGITPSDELEQQLAAANQTIVAQGSEITALGVSIENRDTRIASALDLVNQAQAILSAPPGPAPVEPPAEG